MRRTNFTNTEVASSETARAINRGVILNLIRRRQPISRADLARVSGLQRSTVSLITEQLIDEKWVLYGAVGRLPRGRRPRFLRLNDRRAIVVADVRPIQITIAVADVNGHFLAQQSMPTGADARVAIKELAARIQKMIQGHPDLIFEGVGISLPGRFDESAQRLMFAPNLRWGECDLKGPIEKATRLRVELENAANACVLAEVWFGQADRIRDLVVVTVSEGVGTGVFANGQLARGWNGMAGEFGHVSLNPDGPLCTCGGRGCWEVYASNRAALRYYHESSSTESSTTKDGPSFPDLLDLAGSEDALALRALEKMAHAVGRGIRMIVAGLAPEEILVVGEFTRFWKQLGPIVEAEVAEASFVGKPPRLRPSDDPSRARLRGAVALVLQKHFGPSTPRSQPRESLDQHERIATIM
jgi:predicted NBD/HSP70 family sugar kinase